MTSPVETTAVPPHRIALLTLGTRGDVQPFLALAKRLVTRGHDVVLAAPSNFETWIESHGIRFHSMGMDLEALMRSDEARAIVAGGWHRLPSMWRSTILPLFEASLAAVWAAGRDADVLVFHPKVYAATDLAEATGATPIVAAPVPVFPTGDFANLLLPGSYGRRLNRWSWALFHASRLPYVRSLDRWRSRVLGLGPGPRWAPVGGSARGLAMRLCAASPAVLPKPSDWDDDLHLTGYWQLDEGTDWVPDPALEAFLSGGAPPVYVGFGSMTSKDPAARFRLIAEALQRAGLRAVVASGWEREVELEAPPHVHLVRHVPHGALFPRVRAVVHHGGAGTTAAGLRAGRPSLVCPQAVDQPFWGRRVAALGAGPKPLPRRDWSASSLSERLRELVSNPAYARRSEALADALAQEDGVGRAAELIEEKARQSAGDS